MREEKDLNHLLNTSKDGNGNNDVLQQLQSVTKQRVEALDYQQQIERWNQYQELLDEIDKRCGRRVGVELARNVKHNIKIFTEVSSIGLFMTVVVALMTFLGATTIHSTYGMIGSIAALSFVVWQTAIRLHHPSVIRFKCSPVLHIDEFAYMRQAIKRIPPAEHDPIVRLPVLEMSIPRAWLAQQGMLKFMESLRDIKLEEKSASRQRNQDGAKENKWQ